MPSNEHRNAAVTLTAELGQLIDRNGEWDTHREAVGLIAALLEAHEAAARAEEREACALVADGRASSPADTPYERGWCRAAELTANDIRARGGSNA